MFSSIPQLNEIITQGTSLEQVHILVANEIFPKIEWIYTDEAFKGYAPDNDNIRYHEAGNQAF